MHSDFEHFRNSEDSLLQQECLSNDAETLQLYKLIVIAKASLFKYSVC